MEMEFKDDSRRRRIAMILGVVLAIAAGGAAFFLGSQKPATAEPITTRSVVVAAVEIPARTLIESSFLTMREVIDDPSVAYAISDPAGVLGLVTGVTVFAGQVLTPNLLATTSANANFSVMSPAEALDATSPNWRAASIKVDKDRAVGGQIEPGQHVDVVSTVQINVLTEQADGSLGNAPSRKGYYSDKTTKILWTDVKVLAVDPEDDLYILRLDAHQGEELAHLQASGNGGDFSLMLRSDGDIRILERDGYGETIDRIIEQYGFALPRIINVDRYPQPSPEPVTLDATPAPPVVPATATPGSSDAPAASPSPAATPARSPTPEARATPEGTARPLPTAPPTGPAAPVASPAPSPAAASATPPSGDPDTVASTTP